jgi:glycosyltransferase involved in cell wall biosynthesis
LSYAAPYRSSTTTLSNNRFNGRGRVEGLASIDCGRLRTAIRRGEARADASAGVYSRGRARVRIWILNHYASPPDQPAGTRHYDLGRVLAGQGHDVTIFASSFSHVTLREERLRRNERVRIEYIDGVRFVWVRTMPYSGNDGRRALNMLSYALGAIRAQRRMTRPDVVVGSSVHPVAAAAACLLGGVRRVPFVFEVRDLWPQTLVDIGALKENGATTRALRGLECFLYRRARVVISLLPKATDYITLLGIPAEKIVYVPNGIADYGGRVPDMNDSGIELVAKIAEWRRAGYLVAGYVGSYVQANRVDTLVEAARILHDRGVLNFAFVFVGDGPEKERSQRLARHYSLRNVLFWQPLPKCSVPGVLDALDVTLFSVRDIPVFKYGLSCNKLFDYLASGRPVVSACAVEDTPVTASGGGICVPSDSPAAIADALVELAAMGEEGRLAMGERGRRWVYQHHGATTLAGRFLQALVQAQQ